MTGLCEPPSNVARGRTAIVGVIGPSGSGKTTLVTELVRALGDLKVGTMKHIHHVTYDFDVPGKDTWRMFVAGSVLTVGTSPVMGHIAVRVPLSPGKVLEVAKALSVELDVLLVEGLREELCAMEEAVTIATTADYACRNTIAVVERDGVEGTLDALMAYLSSALCLK